MTVVQVSPNGSSAITAVTMPGGGATLHAALADGTDTQYGRWAINGDATVTFANPTLTGSNICKEVKLSIRDEREVTGYLNNPWMSYILYGTGLNFDAAGRLDAATGVGPTQPGGATFWQENYSASWQTYVTHLMQPVPVLPSTLPTSISVRIIRVFQDSTFDWYRLAELRLNATFVVQPTVSVTAPTGTVTTAGTPTITWTPTFDTDGGYPTHYEVKIYNSTEYGAGGFDPATSAYQWGTGAAHASSDTQWSGLSQPSGFIDPRDLGGQLLPGGGPTSPTPDKVGALPDATYRAFVRIAQTVNGQLYWSAWSSSGPYTQFTMTTPKPAVPTLTVTADNANARISLLLHDNSGTETTDYFQIDRSIDGGTTWMPVRTTQGGGWVANPGPDVTIYDYEASNGQTVNYRMRAAHANLLAQPTAGNFSVMRFSTYTTGSSSWTSSLWWLKHPTDPTLNVGITARSQPGRSRAARVGVHTPLGATSSIAVTDTPGPWTGDLVAKVSTEADRVKLDALVAGASPVLVQAPASTPDWTSDRWVALGDFTRNRLVDSGNTRFLLTFDSLPWTEVERPSDPLGG